MMTDDGDYCNFYYLALEAEREEGKERESEKIKLEEHLRGDSAFRMSAAMKAITGFLPSSKSKSTEKHHQQ